MPSALGPFAEAGAPCLEARPAVERGELAEARELESALERAVGDRDAFARQKGATVREQAFEVVETARPTLASGLRHRGIRRQPERRVAGVDFLGEREQPEQVSDPLDLARVRPFVWVAAPHRRIPDGALPGSR